jgi:hypothetical protein
MPTESDVYSAASELGIDPNSLDESSDFETEGESTEAEAEVKDEAVEAEEEFSTEEDSEETDSALEGEEKEEVQATEEAVKEGPKLTAKEFQEIEAAKQAFEAEKKAFTERMQKEEKEFLEKYHTKVKDFDEIDAFLGNLAKKDPELFGILQSEMNDYQEKFSNPVINELKERNLALEKKLDAFLNKASDDVTLTKLDSEFEKFMSTTGKDAETAGLKIDRKVIEDLWEKGLTVEEAFHAKYGSAYAKALVSKQKVAQVEKKVQARPTVPTAGSVKRSNTPANEKVPTKAEDAVRYFAKKITGKA